MNTIPSIFNENLTPYTAVGGSFRGSLSGISLVVLNPKGHIKRSIFREIENTGFDKVISIETASPHYDIEDMAKRFPFVRFIIPKKDLNLGEQINLAAASEIDSPLFLVLRNDMKIIAGGTARRMAERELERPQEEKRLCTVPVIVNSNYELLPTIASCVTKKNKLRTVCMEPHNESALCLYPFDGIGIYNRERFINTGGYDPAINKTYWQLMDFGFRSFLWGEQIALSLHLKFSYDGEIPLEETTLEENYRRFYLKNLSPVLKNDYARLPYFRFPFFCRNSNLDIFNALKEFKEGRKWVKKNKYRWKLDAKEVAKLWSEN